MSPRMAAPPAPRSPWQLLYGNAHRLRRAWYRRHAERLPLPVISIGNLHWGGSGKTPLTAAVAAHLRDAGHRVCILSRGYGRRDRAVQVVSDGGGALLPPHLAGDEPLLLAEQLRDVAVVVGRSRAVAGREAIARLPHPPQLFLLDDGFSHLALHRDLDLLTFPAGDPFGGGRLAPSGRLREPLAAVARADAVVLTGLGRTVDLDRAADRLAAALGPHGFNGPAFASRLIVRSPRLEDGRPLPADARVLLVAGIARPARFLASSRQAGIDVAGELLFPDHHPFPADSLRAIGRAAAAAGADAVLTTEKDRVKLAGRLPLPLAELPVRAEPQPALWHWLDARLADLREAAVGLDGARR